MKPTVLSSHIAHENSWYRIRRDELIWPNGKPGEYFVAEFGKTVLVLAVEQEKVLTVEQYRHPQGETHIELVKGGVEPDESPLETAKRELLEEAGYTAGHMELLGNTCVFPGVTNQQSSIFLATNLQRAGEQQLEDSEHGLCVRWIPLQEWTELIRQNHIKDAETLAAWTLYQNRQA